MLRFRVIYEIWRRDNSLTQALKESYSMLEKTHTMFRASVKFLRDGKATENGLSVYEEDRIINERQMGVRRKILRYLAVAGTVDLLPGLVLTSIVIDIERIGDYTKNITDLAMVQNGKLTCGSFETRVRELEGTVERLFREVRPLLASSDIQAARQLSKDCSWIRKGANDILTDLVRGTDESLDPGQSAATALYVRYLKRIGAHLLNVLSSVVNPFEKIGYREENVNTKENGPISQGNPNP
jgi:phosphate uptake regulator